MTMQNEYREYKVRTTHGTIKFKGRYRRDLETANWHYYEEENGNVIHFKKESMICVSGDTIETIKNNRQRTNLNA